MMQNKEIRDLQKERRGRQTNFKCPEMIRLTNQKTIICIYIN